MSRVGQTVRVRGVVGGGSGERANGDNGSPVAAGGSWTVDYLAAAVHTPPTHNEWDDSEQTEFDGTDEMVILADGIFLVIAGTAYYADAYQTSGYSEVNLQRNGVTVASYSSSFQNDVTFGYIQMPRLRWAGACAAGDRFSLVASNNADSAYYFGYYVNFIYTVFIASA